MEISQNFDPKIEKFSLNFSSCNPFPSWSSAAKDTCQQFQRTNKAIVNKSRPLFVGFLQWVIPEKIHTPPPPPRQMARWKFSREGQSKALEILTGGGGLDLKFFLGGSFSP